MTRSLSQLRASVLSVMWLGALMVVGCSDGSVTGIERAGETAYASGSISVAPGAVTLSPGQSQQLAATHTYTNGATTPSWSSSNVQVARVTSSGLVTAVAPGTAYITASLRGSSASSVVTVSSTQSSASSVSVSPSSATLAVQQTQQLVATVRDAAGNIMENAPVTWTSSNTAVATVSAAGLVTAVAIGTATIRATSGTASGTSAVSVTETTPPQTVGVIFRDDFEMTNWTRSAAGWDTDWNIQDISTVSGIGGRAGKVSRFYYNAPAGVDRNVALTLNTGTLPTDASTLFIRGYLYMPDPVEAGKRRMQRKLFYLTGHSSPRFNLVLMAYGDGGNNNTIPEWRLVSTVNGQETLVHWSGIDAAFNTWLYVEMEVRLNTPGRSDGVVRLWVNNASTPIIQLSGLNLRGSSSSGYTEFMLGQQLQGDQNALSEYRYWDDVVVSTNRIGSN